MTQPFSETPQCLIGLAQASDRSVIDPPSALSLYFLSFANC
ncbi:MAG TPA: hypothetical protein V6D34_02730 [Candidatus Sericytochromatia bacterium]